MAEGDRARALELALAQLDKQFGKGSVMRLGEAQKSMQVEAISTGSIGLDIALGIGGIPRGRVTEIYGPESAGKSTMFPRRFAPTLRLPAARRCGQTPALKIYGSSISEN